jgi:hypothetical protein
VDDVGPDLRIPRGFWSTAGGKKFHRHILLKEGFERYGYPESGKSAADVQPERIKRIWPLFMQVV